MPVRRSNLFGFGRKKKATPAPAAKRRVKKSVRSEMTAPQAGVAAYEAGLKSGDDGLFAMWLERAGLTDRGDILRTRLEREYRRGVHDAIEGTPYLLTPGKKKTAPELLKLWKSNPEFRAAVHGARRGGQDVLKFYDSVSGAIWDVTGGIPRRIVGAVVGEKRNASASQPSGTFTITDVKYDRESNKTWASVSTDQFKSVWFAISGRVPRKELKSLLWYSVDRELEKLGVHPNDRLARVNPQDSDDEQRWNIKEEVGKGQWRITHRDLSAATAESICSLAMASPGGYRCKMIPAKPKKKASNPRNPQDAAESLYESFHGKSPDGVTIVEEEIHEHEHLATLGLLVNFRVATLSGYDMLIGTPDAEAQRTEFDETAAKADSTFLAANEDGTQLYFKGGDQSFPLDRCKMGEGSKWYRDDMIIGVIYEVTYRTRKKFDKFKLTDYYHELGEETGVQPMLRYDPLSPHLYISGGQYKIKMPMVGMSPGIEN